MQVQRAITESVIASKPGFVMPNNRKEPILAAEAVSLGQQVLFQFCGDEFKGVTRGPVLTFAPECETGSTVFESAHRCKDVLHGRFHRSGKRFTGDGCIRGPNGHNFDGKRDGKRIASSPKGVCGMKELVIVLCLAGLVPVQNATARIAFPWLFHTRPKPVMLDQSRTERAKTSHSIAWHGTEKYPSSGRLYFRDSNALRDPAARQTKARPSETVHTIRAFLKK
jgi:hypothetical protein